MSHEVLWRSHENVLWRFYRDVMVVSWKYHEKCNKNLIEVVRVSSEPDGGLTEGLKQTLRRRSHRAELAGSCVKI